MDIEVLRLINQAAYLAVAVTSFSLFLLLAAFKGKRLIDWMLLVRDLLLAVMSVRFFLLDTFGTKLPVEFRVAQWVSLTAVCVVLFIALVREHTIYRKKYLTQDK